MKPDHPADPPGTPEAAPASDAEESGSAPVPDEPVASAGPKFVPAGAEAVFPSVPVEALPPLGATDQVLAPPVPAEALLGADPAGLLPATPLLTPVTEVPVPPLDKVVSEASDTSDTSEASDTSDTSCLAGGGEMGALMRSVDWSLTPLGAVTEWPQPLRLAVSIMLNSGFPMLIVWGPECIQLYNDAYRPVLGATKHPAALGGRASDTWPELWTTMLAPMFQQVMSTGEPFKGEDRLFVLDRNGAREECYFTFSWGVIRDERDRPGGVLVALVETTDRVVGDRRLRTLHAIAANAARSDSESDACEVIANALAANPHDLPFALLYIIDKDRLQARLCATAQIAAGTDASPDAVDLADGDDGEDVWPLARVARTDLGEVVPNLTARAGPLPGGPWPEPADTAIALPIRYKGDQTSPSGVLVAGVSPRRPLDAAYRNFLDLAAAQISTTLANARAHERERRRSELLMEGDRAKTAFFSNVSHELRTPLTLMLGPAGDLLAGEHGELSPAQRDQVRLLRRNAARLLKLVDSLLDFSQIEAERVDATFEPTDLAAFTSDLASVFRSAIERAGLTLIIDCPPLEEPVYVDRSMWERIVLNLVSNALKFTLEGRIQVALRARGEYVELVVGDTGTGIAAGDLPHLFTHFHRVRGARARSHEGSGVGLALVHELVRIHGGSVDVASEPDRGSTFTVRVRTGDAHLSADRIRRSRPLTSMPGGAAPFVEEALRWIDEGASDEPASQPARVDDATAAVNRMDDVAVADVARSARVLIADDHADMRQYLTRLLRRRWNVESVADGRDALDAVRARRPDLIVADVMMPGLDGIELLRTLRASADTADIPVLLLSGHAGEESRIEGLNAGAADYVVKPFFARELVAKIQSQIEQLWVRRQADRERARLRSLFNDAPVPICILRGPELRFEFVNPPYARLFGNRELLGRTVHEALPEIAGQGLFEALERVLRTGETFWGIEVPIRLAPEAGDADQPGEFFFNFVYQAMRESGGAIDGIVVFAVDVTEQVLIRRKIEESIQTRDTFFAAAAHELRNPINALQLQLLGILRAAERSDDALQVDWVRARVGKAVNQVSRLVRLVDNLLDVSRIASGRLHLDLEPVDLAAVVAEALDRLDLPEQAQITWTLEPAIGQWDRLRLDQIVTNLVSNALKYGEGQPIEISVKASGGHALLEVADHGIGIAAEHQARIFERFERAVADRRYAGFGLGLWITSRIVDEFGGTLSVRSEPGAGSTFMVRLPLEPGRSRQSSS